MAHRLKAFGIPVFSFVVFAALVSMPLVLVGPRVESQPAPATVVNTASKLVWEHDNQDINNQPELLLRFDVAISQTNQDLSTGGTPLATIQVGYPCPECPVNTTTLGTTCEWPLTQLLQGRAAGYYRLWVRAVDTALNVGAWSLPLTVQTDPAPPKPPFGLKCK